MTPLISIVRTGLACPLGLYSAAALAAARAGLTRFERLEVPAVTISRLSRLDAELSRGERMRALMRYALAEVGQIPGSRPLSALPVFLSLPAPDSGAPYDEQVCLEALRDEALNRLGVQLRFSEQAIVRSGRAGLFTALERAASFLATGAATWGLVGAMDSLVDGETVARLAASNLLLGDSNLDGRIASEAAGFFLVGRSPVGHAGEHIVAFAAEQDAAHGFAAVQAGASRNTAAGLTRLFRRLGMAFSSRIDAVISAQPGEGFWSREFSYAYLRNVHWMPEPLRMEAVGTTHGDVGAAAGAMALVHALTSLCPQRGASRPAARSVLLYGASDSGELGGCALVAV